LGETITAPLPTGLPEEKTSPETAVIAPFTLAFS